MVVTMPWARLCWASDWLFTSCGKVSRTAELMTKGLIVSQTATRISDGRNAASATKAP